MDGSPATDRIRKSQSTLLYSAMLSEFNDFEHPGVLIVSRLIEDCIKMADDINKYGVRESAAAFHSDKSRLRNGVSMTSLDEYPVVCITHRAYELALDYLGKDSTIINKLSSVS